MIDPAMDGTRRVLLYFENEVQAEYVRAVGDILRGDRRIDVWMWCDPARRSSTWAAKLATHHGFPFTQNLGREHWDLAVYSHHPRGAASHVRARKLYVGHALAANKGSKGGKGEGAFRHTRERLLDAEGLPVYECIFVASEDDAQRALSTVPEMAGRVAVVGDLMADRLLGLERHRSEVRARLGFAPRDRVIALVSTWEQTGLLAAHGDELIEDALRLQETGQFRFLLLPHPLMIEESRPSGRAWRHKLEKWAERGLAIRWPDEHFAPFLVAADAAVTDYTSLALTFSLLHRPLGFVLFPEDRIGRNTVAAELHVALPHLDPHADLGRFLNVLLQEGCRPAQALAARKLLSCAGNARTRFGTEVYRLLSLTPPSGMQFVSAGDFVVQLLTENSALRQENAVLTETRSTSQSAEGAFLALRRRFRKVVRSIGRQIVATTRES